MSDRERICVFYTVPEQYDSILKALRRKHPDSHITAIVPTAYVDASVVAPLVDEAVRPRYDRYPAYLPWRIVHLVRTLRRGNYDHFVVIFESVKLQLLAAMSGAKKSSCWALHGRVVPLETNVLKVAWSFVWRMPACWGRILRVWFSVYIRRANSAPD